MTWDPAWKSLVETLVDEGIESPYLDRLRERYDIHSPRESIEREVLREMASALARAEDKVNVALLQLELIGHKAHDRASIEAFNAQRERAIQARRDLAIHREALRFPRDPNFETRYPIPPKRSLPDR